MPHFETAATIPYPDQLDADPEHLAEIDQEVAEGVGHVALNGDVEIDFDQIEAYANGEGGQAVTAEHGQEDTRVLDIEAAHEAALLENEIFDAHVAALKENEIFDAHVAAIKEDQEREAEIARNAEAEQKASSKVETPEATTTPTSQDLRREAATVLSQVSGNVHLSPSSTVTKDQRGNLLILDDADATVITRAADGTPKLTEYHYDEESGVLTIDAGHYGVLDHATDYRETALQDWQSHDEIVTLPPQIAKRFGIERAVAVKH